MVLGVLVFLLYGILDVWSVPPEQMTRVWSLRLIALTVPVTVFALSFLPGFQQICHWALAAVGLSLGLGFIAIFLQLPQQSLSLYYPGMVLVTFFTYNLIGTRFIHALGVDLILLTTYNLVFGLWHEYPLPMMISHDFFIISANLIGGGAGYLQERQRRVLFLREELLEEQKRQHLKRALHDPLTGLPNRDLLNDQLDNTLLRARRDNDRHAAFFIDLDGFKHLNDMLGHEEGDRALQDIAIRLRGVSRDSDTVCRLGGDEFFVLSQDIKHAGDALIQAERILEVIRNLRLGPDKNSPLSASIGICLIPYEGATVSDVIRRADEAMYVAKKTGKNRSHFCDEPRPLQVLEANKRKSPEHEAVEA